MYPAGIGILFIINYKEFNLYNIKLIATIMPEGEAY